MSATSFVIPTGEVLGGYRILDVIGLGGMAVVYRAEQLSLGREVALKVLAPAISGDLEFRERFRREGKAVAGLEHPSIVSIYDSGEADGRLFLAMRLVRGVTLAQRIGERSLTSADALALLSPIADALDFAHRRGFIHRDVKPQNILISEDGRAFLADFGIATDGGNDGLTATGGFIGSCYYAAPEQIQGEQVSPATDVYALTALLFQVLTGRVPYPRDTESGIMQAHMSEPIPTVVEDGDAAIRLNRAIALGMAKSPGMRYGSPRELLADISDAFDALPEARRQAPAPFLVDTAAASAFEFNNTVRRGAPLKPSSVPELPLPTPGSVSRQEMAALAGDLATPEQANPAPQPEGAAAPASVLDEDSRGSSSIPTVGTDAGSASRNRIGVVMGLCLAVVVVVVVVVVIAQGGSSPTKVARSGNISLRYRQPWTLASGGAQYAGLLSVPALHFKSSIGAIDVGQLQKSAATPAAVPPGLVTVAGQPESSRAARFGGHPAREYIWTKPGATLVALVAATTSADVVVICSGRTSAITSACVEFGHRTSFSDTAFLAPGTDRGLQRKLTSVLTRTAPSAAERAALRAPKLHARVTALATLALRSASVARALRRVVAPSRFSAATTGLADGVRRQASALSALAAAAGHDRTARVNSLIPRLHAASVAIAAQVHELGSFGIELRYAPPTVAKARIIKPLRRTKTQTSAASGATSSGSASSSSAVTAPADSSSSASTPAASTPASSTSATGHTTSSASSTKRPSTSSSKTTSKSSSPIIQQGGSS